MTEAAATRGANEQDRSNRPLIIAVIGGAEPPARAIFLAEEEEHQPRCLLPLSSYNPPIVLEIYLDRLAQARRLYAEFRIEGIWKNDYSLFIRPHHNVLNFSEWQHLGRFRTAIIFAMQAPIYART